MNKWMAAAALTVAMPMASAKVLISIDGGLGYNLNSLSADSSLASGTNNEINLANTDSNTGSAPYNLGMEANGGFYGWASISIPLVPDVKVKYESLTLEGTNDINSTVDVFGTEYQFSGEIESKLDLSHVDLAVTIGLPLPVVDVDLGLNGRAFLGGFEATGSIGGQSQTVDAPFSISDSGTPLFLPMGYASVAATIPGVGVKLGGEIATLPLGDTNITDFNVKGTWYAPLPTNLLVKLGLEAGYRNFTMKIGESTIGLDTSDLQSEVSISSFFVGAAMHF